MKQITLTKGKFALVDDEDYERFNKYRWYLGDGNYAVRKEYVGKIDGKYKSKAFYMHREILNIPESHIDHIDRNGLNNQRSNLRLATRSQNNSNRRKQSNKTSSKYKGVHWNKKDKKWRTQMKINGKQKYIGGFLTEIEAGKAYNEAAKNYFGEFAKLNEV